MPIELDEAVGKLLRARDQDHFLDLLDMAIQAPGLFHIRQPNMEGWLRFSGISNIPEAQNGERYSIALCNEQEPIEPLYVYNPKYVYSPTDDDQLKFWSDPNVPAQVARCLLGGLRSKACVAAIKQTIIRPLDSPKPWLMKLIVASWASGLYEFLRLIASRPGSTVPEAIVPLKDRMDIGDLYKQAEARELFFENVLNDPNAELKIGIEPKMSDIIDFNAKKQEAIHEENHLAFEHGEMFRFEPFVFSSNENNPTVGIIDGDLPIVVMLKGLEGIAMTREDAIKLGEELIRNAKEEFWEGE